MESEENHKPFSHVFWSTFSIHICTSLSKMRVKWKCKFGSQCTSLGATSASVPVIALSSCSYIPACLGASRKNGQDLRSMKPGITGQKQLPALSSKSGCRPWTCWKKRSRDSAGTPSRRAPALELPDRMRGADVGIHQRTLKDFIRVIRESRRDLGDGPPIPDSCECSENGPFSSTPGPHFQIQLLPLFVDRDVNIIAIGLEEREFSPTSVYWSLRLAPSTFIFCPWLHCQYAKM